MSCTGLNVCLFLCFPPVEIKSDDEYQIGRQTSSDNYHPILYHVISFIQREPTEIIQKIIKTNNLFSLFLALLQGEKNSPFILACNQNYYPM